MIQTQLPNLPDKFSNSFVHQLSDLLTRIYTDISWIFEKTEVSDPDAMGNEDDEIGGLTFSNPPTQTECEALRDKCEELADDVRNLHSSLSDLINSLQTRELV